MICGPCIALQHARVRVSQFICYRVAASTPLPLLAVGSHVLTTHGRRLTHRRSAPILNVRTAYGSCRVD